MPITLYVTTLEVTDTGVYLPLQSEVENLACDLDGTNDYIYTRGVDIGDLHLKYEFPRGWKIMPKQKGGDTHG